MQASAFEYKHRYLIHGIIYTLCFAAPWPQPGGGSRIAAWTFINGNSTWFLLARSLSRPLFTHFAFYWNTLLVVMILFAAAGAALRIWGAAYLGATTVQRGNMVGDRIVAGGPYRFVRNPLYLGTVLNTVAIAILMRPDAAVLCVVLITLVQMRLIGREEPYLAQQLGPAYAAYVAAVPRFFPSLQPRTAQGTARPDWRSGLLSEVYVTGAAVSMLLFGWSNGFAWENAILHVMQGIIVGLGLSFVARAFIPKATL